MRLRCCDGVLTRLFKDDRLFEIRHPALARWKVECRDCEKGGRARGGRDEEEEIEGRKTERVLDF